MEGRKPAADGEPFASSVVATAARADNPVVIGNRHVELYVSPSSTFAMRCTICGEAVDVGCRPTLDEFRERTTTFASLHFDCRFSPRPGYGTAPRVYRATENRRAGKSRTRLARGQLVVDEGEFGGDPEAE